jgi:hypothetical protein
MQNSKCEIQNANRWSPAFRLFQAADMLKHGLQRIDATATSAASLFAFLIFNF